MFFNFGKTNIAIAHFIAGYHVPKCMEKAMRVTHVDNSFAVSECGHVVVSVWGMCNMLVSSLGSPGLPINWTLLSDVAIIQ